MKTSTTSRIITLILATVCILTCLCGCKKKEQNTDFPTATVPPLPHISEIIGAPGVGNQLAFGSYEQNGNTDDGKEPIEWTVAYDFNSGDKKKMLLISNECLLALPYNDELADVTWETCSLRKYLNEEFCNEAFTSDEQKYLVTSRLSNLPNSTYPDVDAGVVTEDNVFVPDFSDYGAYLDSLFISADAELTASAKATLDAIEDKDTCDGDAWWLRNPGASQQQAMVLQGGAMAIDNGYDVNKVCGVRIAVWVVIG